MKGILKQRQQKKLVVTIHKFVSLTKVLIITFGQFVRNLQKKLVLTEDGLLRHLMRNWTVQNSLTSL